MATSDLGKYLKKLAIISAFADYIWIFGASSNLWKPHLKHDIVWKKLSLKKV